MTTSTTADQLEELFEESSKLDAEWRKINVTPTGRLRLRLKPELEARSEEIRKRSNVVSKTICELVNETYDKLTAPRESVAEELPQEHTLQPWQADILGRVIVEGSVNSRENG